MHKPTPKYLLVEQHIKKAIKKGTIVNKLPGERTLASDLGFSYMTIRKAVENLVTEGILYKVPTKGTFIADKRSAKKTMHTIGYFLDGSITSGLTSPYYSLIFNALEKEAALHGYSLVYFSDAGNDNIEKTVSKLDGVIVSSFPRIENIIQQIKNIAPVVVIDNSSSDKTIPSVIIDNFNAVVESLDYLYSLGHRRIAFMTGLEDSDVGKDRCAGYQGGLSKYGINFDQSLIYRGNYAFEAGLQGAEYYLSLEQPPTAIMCANDSMALGAMRKLYESGLQIPNDISVMGFDDIEVASQIQPALTTIAAPINQIAKRSFDLIHQLILGDQLDNMHIALSAGLVVRQSCAEAQ